MSSVNFFAGVLVVALFLTFWTKRLRLVGTGLLVVVACACVVVWFGLVPIS